MQMTASAAFSIAVTFAALLECVILTPVIDHADPQLDVTLLKRVSVFTLDKPYVC